MFCFVFVFRILPNGFKRNLREMRENTHRKFLKSSEWRVNLPDNESTRIKIMWFGSGYWQKDKWNTMNVPESTQECKKQCMMKVIWKQLEKWNYSIRNYGSIKKWSHSHWSLRTHEYSRWMKQLNEKSWWKNTKNKAL